jgi:hypothetical protein
VRLDIGGDEVATFDLAFKRSLRAWLQIQLDAMQDGPHVHRVPSLAHDLTLAQYFGCQVDGVAADVLRKAWNGVDETAKFFNAQFQPWRGWRKSGFGIPSCRRDLAMGLKAVASAKAALERTTGRAFCHTASAPHMIAKLPGLKPRDGYLAEHNDDGSLEDVLRLCIYHRGDLDFERWAEEEGRQVLAHVKVSGGHTGFVRWLTPRRYAVCLLMWAHGYARAPPPKEQCKKVAADPHAVVHKPFPPGFQAPTQPWFKSRGGPVFQPWKKMVDPSNEVIAFLESKAGMSAEAVLAQSTSADMRALLVGLQGAGQLGCVLFPAGYVTPPPLEACIMVPPEGADVPMVVAWPCGTPHWAEGTGGRSRYTFTVPLRQKAAGVNAAPVASRGFDHLRRMADIAFEKDPQSRATLLSHVAADNVPWHGGIVHKHPGKMAAMTFGVFRELVATTEDVEAYIKVMAGSE